MGSLLSLAKKLDVFIIGVGELSDSYANYKYKYELITESKDILSGYRFFSTGDKSYWNMATSGVFLQKLGKAVKLLVLSFCVFMISITKRTNTIYVFYPSLIISLFFCLVPRAVCSKLVLDVFISIYDTVVIDRQLIGKKTFLAKLLFLLERLSFWRADIVIVDTEQNADYYAKLFSIDREKFVVVPLSIPNLEPLTSPNSVKSNNLNVFFFGTFVPLHGISIIIQAAKIVKAARSSSSTRSIQITIVGDGQESHLLETAIANGLDNIIWLSKHCSANQLAKLISEQDLMLGVFSENDKTRRVVPYKHYYYLSLGKPVLTARTPAIESLSAELSGVSPFILVSPGSPDELAAMLLEQCEKKNEFQAREAAARKLFEQSLSVKSIESKLKRIFNSLSSN